MFKYTLCLVLLALFVTSHSSHGAKIVIAESYQLTSSVLKEQRPYSVYLPPSYQDSKDQRYPVIYLLDGDQTRLKGLSGLVESLSSYNLERQIPEFIIVAIGNTNRDRDLTPTKTDLIFKGKTLAKLPETGGADNFSSFIKTELLPHIEGEYRTNQRRALFGLSFAGLFAAHQLLTEPALFSDYMIIDATYVWDNNYLNQLSFEKLKSAKSKEIRVFLALANNDHIGEHGIANRQWGNEFIGKLQMTGNDKLTINSKYFAQERHGTVEMLAWYYGLLSLFKS